jgi:arginase
MVKMPFTGARNVPEISDVPNYLEDGGLAGLLRDQGAVLRPMGEIGLAPEQQEDYGNWHRMGMANGHLANFVAQSLRGNFLHVGLLANCTSLIGVLAGLQQVATSPERIGLVFIDAHGDFNTPESTLSGMLGGMPVAVAAGLGLHNLRNESGLLVPIPTENIVLGAVRDLDPLERDLVEEHGLARFSTDDIRSLSPRLHEIMRDLSERTDVIYIHIDMDVLDPAEVPGHPLTVPNGPTSKELAAAIALMFTYDKAVAFGVASTPANNRDPDGVSRQAAYRLIQGAVAGVQRRATP